MGEVSAMGALIESTLGWRSILLAFIAFSTVSILWIWLRLEESLAPEAMKRMIVDCKATDILCENHLTGLPAKTALLAATAIVVLALLIFVFKDKRFRATGEQVIGGVILGLIITAVSRGASQTTPRDRLPLQLPPSAPPAPLYLRPADAAPSRDAPPVILDDT